MLQRRSFSAFRSSAYCQASPSPSQETVNQGTTVSSTVFRGSCQVGCYLANPTYPWCLVAPENLVLSSVGRIGSPIVVDAGDKSNSISAVGRKNPATRKKYFPSISKPVVEEVFATNSHCFQRLVVFSSQCFSLLSTSCPN
jgi:hypothetical protein